MKRKLVLGLALVIVLGGATGAFYLTKKSTAPPTPPQTANANAGVSAAPRTTAPPDTAAPATPPATNSEKPAAPPKSAEQPRTGTTAPPRGNGTRPNGGAPFDREKFAQFQETHKYTFQLTRLVGNVMRMEREEKTPLTAQQAKDLLAVLQPLRKQEKMTQDDAKAAIRDVQRVLTEEQRTAIAAMPERGGGPGGGGMRGGNNGAAPGGGAPGGGMRGRPGGGNGGTRGTRPMMDPTTMQNFNPFYKPEGDDGGRVMSRRWDMFFETLEKKASQ